MLAAAGIAVAGLTVVGLARSHRAREEPPTTDAVGFTSGNIETASVAASSVGGAREAARVEAGHRRNVKTAPTVGSRVLQSLLAGQTITELRAHPKVAQVMDSIPPNALDAAVQYAQGPGRAADPDSVPTTAERDIVEGMDIYLPYESHATMHRQRSFS